MTTQKTDPEPKLEIEEVYRCDQCYRYRPGVVPGHRHWSKCLDCRMENRGAR